MGLFDFERLKEEKYPVKNSTGSYDSVLDIMSKNTNWVEEITPYVLDIDPVASLLNRKVFKATKLREEIYFIKCRCYNLDNGFNEFVFLVNEHTIYKRFRIYKNDDEFYYKSELNLQNFIKLLKHPDYRKVLKLFNNEISDLPDQIEQAYNNTNAYKYYKTWGFRDGMPIEVLNIQHFNKRTWIYLLTTNNTTALDLDYKNTSSDAYFDENFAKKYN